MPLPPPRKPQQPTPTPPQSEAPPPALPLTPEEERMARRQRLRERELETARMSQMAAPFGMQNMPKKSGRKKWVIALQILGMLLLAAGVLFFTLSEGELIVPHNTQADQIRKWARLNPLPDSARDIHITMPEDNLQRVYSLEFRAREQEIRDWLAYSPSTAKTQPIQETGPEGMLQVYLIHRQSPDGPAPAGSSSHGAAKVIWSTRTGQVRLIVPLGFNEDAMLLKSR